MNLKIMHTIYNNFGRDGGATAIPLYIYFFKVVKILALYIFFFEVVIFLGKTEVRRPDHSAFIFSRS